jgi:hypothetical protein
LRASERIAPALVVGLALTAGCSPNVLVVIGTDLCADGGTVGCHPTGPLDDLVGWWPLDETAGSTTAQDRSLRGNNGTLVDLDPATAWVAGRGGNVLAVNAAGFVNVERSLSIDSITDQVTIAGWAYLEGTVMDYATVASREIGDTIDQHYHISIDSMDKPTLWIQTDVKAVRLTTATTARMTWVHITGTYDGSAARLYVDGQFVTSQPLTGHFAADTTPFILGANGNGVPGAPTERFPGRIDEIALYRRALAADEIAQLYSVGLSPSRSTDAAAGN